MKPDTKRFLEKVAKDFDLCVRQWEMYITDEAREDIEDILQNDISHIEAQHWDMCEKTLRKFKELLNEDEL